MGTIAEDILALLAQTDGRTDREITDVLRGHAANQQPINAACRKLEARGLLIRRKRADGLIGNFLAQREPMTRVAPNTRASEVELERSQSSAAGDSLEQRTAEAYLIDGLAKRLGVGLTKRKLPLPDGGWLELDGSSDSPSIVCEAWAHIGLAKVAQRHKLMSDAFKLIFAAQFLPKETRKILVLADSDAAKHLRGKGWMAQALNANHIELQFIDLPRGIMDSIRSAQRRQFR